MEPHSSLIKESSVLQGNRPDDWAGHFSAGSSKPRTGMGEPGAEEKQLKHLDPVLFPSPSPAQTLQCGWALTGGATDPEAQGRF